MPRITKIEPTAVINNNKLRVAAYARVSTASDEQLLSLQTQKNHYDRYIKARHDWEYAGLYYDEGVSGTKMEKRDGLKRLLEDCKNGLIDYIIVKSVSRFSRNTVDCIEIVRTLYQRGIYIYFEKENIDTGKVEGELMLSILSSLAESESRSISENELWAIKRRYMNGTFKIGFPPYGYNSIRGQMVVDPEKAETVRWIFDQVLNGKSAGEIADELNQKGISSKCGVKWTNCVISRMIRNEKYTGDAIFQKSYTDQSFNRHINKGERDRYYVKDHHEPIVSHEVFEAANAIIERNCQEKGIQRDTEKYGRRYAMSGKIICAECGNKLKRVCLYSQFGYKCRTHLENKDACSLKSVKEEPIKAAFVTMMNKLTFARGRVLIPYEESLKKDKGKSALTRIDEIDMLLENNLERRQRILQFFTKGLLDPTVYESENDALLEEERRIKAERDLLSKQASGDKDTMDALKKLLRYTAKGITLIEFNDDLFTEHVDHIIVYGRREIGFAMKCGPVFRERI